MNMNKKNMELSGLKKKYTQEEETQDKKFLKMYGYTFERFIGKGQISRVLKIRNKKQDFAIKIVNKKKYYEYCTKDIQKNQNADQIKMYYDDMMQYNQSTIQEIKSEYVMQNIKEFSDLNNWYYIMNYSRNLKQHINDVNEETGLDELQALKYFYQILMGMKVINENNLMHRNLKLQNIFIENDQIKLTDYGFSRPVEQNCYSPLEIQEGQYDYKVDVWSLGVILFEMLFNFTPFDIRKEYQIGRFCGKGDFDLEKFLNTQEDQKLRDKAKTISKETKDLFKKLLVNDPEDRISYNKILSHISLEKNIVELIDQPNEQFQPVDLQFKDGILNYYEKIKNLSAKEQKQTLVEQIEKVKQQNQKQISQISNESQISIKSQKQFRYQPHGDYIPVPDCNVAAEVDIVDQILDQANFQTFKRKDKKESTVVNIIPQVNNSKLNTNCTLEQSINIIEDYSTPVVIHFSEINKSHINQNRFRK